MLRRLGSKAFASSSSSYGGGRRSATSAVSASVYAPCIPRDLAGGSRCCNEIKELAASLWRRSYTTGQYARLHILTVPITQSLRLKGDKVGYRAMPLGRSSPADGYDDDVFSELGPSLQGNAGPGAESEKQNTAKCVPGMKLDQKVHRNVSRTKRRAMAPNNGGTNNGHLLQLSFVVIWNLPPDISVLELRDAGSVFGEILYTNIRTDTNGLVRGCINFKDPASREKALSAGSIVVGGRRLHFHHGQLKHATIRISNISYDTAEPAIHAKCRSHAFVASLARTKEGDVDVVFIVENRSMMYGLVTQLKNVSLNGCQWSAKLVPEHGQNWKKDTVSSSEEQPTALASQISSHIGNLHQKLKMQKMYLEDLENLHHAILHLKELPAAEN